jgi:hypothetical protein
LLDCALSLVVEPDVRLAPVELVDVLCALDDDELVSVDDDDDDDDDTGTDCVTFGLSINFDSCRWMMSSATFVMLTDERPLDCG